jgi:hypothetical protein
MAARWKIISGFEATSFSASPGSEKSDADALTGNGAFAGTCGATTSWSVSLEISRAPMRCSFSKRSVSLRPIMPAAPRIRTCIVYSLTAPVIAET